MVSAKVLWQAGAVTVPGTARRPLRLEQSERGRVRAKSRSERETRKPWRGLQLQLWVKPGHWRVWAGQ